MNRQQLLLLAALGVGLFLFSSRSRAATTGAAKPTTVQPVSRTVTNTGGGGFSDLLPLFFGNGGDDAIADDSINTGSSGGGATAGDGNSSGPKLPEPPRYVPPTLDDDPVDPPAAGQPAGNPAMILPRGTRLGLDIRGNTGVPDSERSGGRFESRSLRRGLLNIA